MTVVHEPIAASHTPELQMNIRSFAYGMVVVVALIWLTGVLFDYAAMPDGPEVGTVVDTYDRVPVFYNGRVGHSSGRNLAEDGYNLGLKWQNLEFVKRFYLERYGHRMPDTYGHAKTFFDPTVEDGERNDQRDLLQYSNPSSEGPPRPGDIVVFGRGMMSRHGHVAIVSQVTPTNIEVVQQNPGPGRPSRERFDWSYRNGRWGVDEDRVLGWLRRG